MLQSLLLWWVWIGTLVFILGCLRRGWKYASAPEHLRWDLYPVAHEAGRDHGGSYLEEREWWTKTRKRSHFGEFATMFEEIVLLKGVWEHNRPVWYGSLPFHWGLYLLVLTTFGLVPAAFGFDDPGWLLLLSVTGGVGGALLAIGSLVLLLLRVADRKLRLYTASADRLNLVILLAVGALSATVAATSSGMSQVAAAVHSMVRAQAPEVSALLGVQMALAALFLLYMPFTRMIHMFAKYFTYHAVRWDDRPVEKGTVLERRLRAALNFGVSWSADHVRTGKTWADVATTLPGQDGSKAGKGE